VLNLIKNDNKKIAMRIFILGKPSGLLVCQQVSFYSSADYNVNSLILGCLLAISGWTINSFARVGVVLSTEDALA
jgi:hypothetical protein